ncbi:MAG: FKBP-type peptidyl-prolyl cis-trans isomerase N-terminal domain-containing protein [Phycisphaerales bacterium JB060]
MTTRIARTPVVLLALGATAALVGVGAVSASQQAQAGRQAQAQAQLQDPQDVAYAVGFFLGDEVRFGLERDGLAIDTDLLRQGFVDALAGRDPQIDAATMDDALAAAHQVVQARVVQNRLENDPEFKALHDRNLERSNAFHASFADQPGTQTLPSGTQYRVLESARGDAEPVGPDATVVVTVRGALLDGRVFTEGEGIEVRLADLTPGVRELLSLMRPGDWWQLAVPPGLAYGGLGKPEMGVGPNETLIGDVKMLEVR